MKNEQYLVQNTFSSGEISFGIYERDSLIHLQLEIETGSTIKRRFFRIPELRFLKGVSVTIDISSK